MILLHKIWFLLDLYTFDCDENAAKETYDKVCQSYDKLFEILNLPVTKGKEDFWFVFKILSLSL